MYLMPPGTSVNNRKLTGLGRLGRVFPMRPDLAGPVMAFRNRALLSGFGQFPEAQGSIGQTVSPSGPPLAMPSTCTIDPLTGNCLEDEVGMPANPPPSYGPPAPPGSSYGPTGTTVPTPPPGSQGSGQPSTGIIPNIFVSATPSQSPLDYVSPQAAIAAGLNSQVVYAAWAQSLAQFPTTQAALAAGVPSGVINQLWTASRAYVGTAAPAAGTLLGIPTTYLMLGGAGIFALALLGGQKGRR